MASEQNFVFMFSALWKGFWSKFSEWNVDKYGSYNVQAVE